MESLYKYKLRVQARQFWAPWNAAVSQRGSRFEGEEALFGALATTNPLFDDFTEADCQALSEFMTVLRFEQELSIVRRGEAGSWFGILLIGTLRVEVLSGDARTFGGDRSW